jgi:hypothetical protein
LNPSISIGLIEIGVNSWHCSPFEFITSLQRTHSIQD